MDRISERGHEMSKYILMRIMDRISGVVGGVVDEYGWNN